MRTREGENGAWTRRESNLGADSPALVGVTMNEAEYQTGWLASVGLRADWGLIGGWLVLDGLVDFLLRSGLAADPRLWKLEAKKMDSCQSLASR